MFEWLLFIYFYYLLMFLMFPHFFKFNLECNMNESLSVLAKGITNAMNDWNKFMKMVTELTNESRRSKLQWVLLLGSSEYIRKFTYLLKLEDTLGQCFSTGVRVDPHRELESLGVRWEERENRGVTLKNGVNPLWGAASSIVLVIHLSKHS